MNIPELRIPQTNYLEMAIMANKMKNDQTQQNYLDAKFSNEQKEMQWKNEDRLRALEKNKFKDAEDAIEYFKKSAPFVNSGNYNEARQHFIELGANPALLPEGFESPEQFEAWKNQSLFDIDRYQAETARMSAATSKKNAEKEDSTADQKNFKFARSQGFKGSFMDWTKREGKSSDPRYGWLTQKDGSKVWSELKPGTISEKEPSKEEPEDKIDRASKEYIRIMGLIDKAKNSGGLDAAIMASLPEEAKSALMNADRSDYVKVLENYAEAIKNKNGLGFIPTNRNNDQGKRRYKFENGKLVEMN